MQGRAGDNGPERYLVISEPRTPEIAALVDELRRTLELDPAYGAYRITDRRMGRDRDEITIRTRSLLQIMDFLAEGVAVPEGQRAEAGLPAEADTTQAAGSLGRVPFRMRSAPQRPADAFVATRYNGHWYAIAANDIESKRAFNTLLYLFRLLAPERGAAAPLLALPTGP